MGDSRGKGRVLTGGEGAARCPSCSQSPHDERGGMTPVLIPCSRSREWEGGLLISCARATRGLRRPSLDARSGRSSRTPSREQKTSKLGRPFIIGELLARRPPWDQHRCHSKGEKQASLEESFRRMRVARCAQSRATLASPFKEGAPIWEGGKTSKLGGTIYSGRCSFDARKIRDQSRPPKEEGEIARAP